jgi:hypothetical protein
MRSKMLNTAEQHGHPFRSVVVITAIGGRESVAGTTIEIVRVTPIGAGEGAVVATIPEQGEGVREQIAAGHQRAGARRGPTDRSS